MDIECNGGGRLCVWPELGQTQAQVSKREAAMRIIWIELVLRLALAAKHGEKKNDAVLGRSDRHASGAGRRRGGA